MEKPRLVYLVSEDWYFFAHRLPMARAALQAGYEVHVATNVSRHRSILEAEGFQVHPINIYRGSIDPFDYIRAVRSVRSLYLRLKPAVVHHITLQASLVGSRAARDLMLTHINTITGLGSVFTSNTIRFRLARPVVSVLISRFLNQQRSIVTVENADNKASLETLSVNPKLIHVLPGSGIDVTHYSEIPEPNAPITVAFAGRMLEDKGLRNLVAAHALVQERGHQIELVLAGMPDPTNRNSIPLAEIEAWSKRPGVTWLGQVEDVRMVWRRAHIAVSASLGEGLPMSLLEAAACGRPLIATDVAGCRSIARAGVNAITVRPNDPEQLATAMIELASASNLRHRFATAGRQIVETEYSTIELERHILRLYQNVQVPIPREES